MYDFVAVSGRLDGRMTEYADHLHEHMVQRLVGEGGRYRAPVGPGLGVALEPASLERYSFPGGSYWSGR
jgi:L-fuconate dehydratase